jgi:hypothetical protein
MNSALITPFRFHYSYGACSFWLAYSSAAEQALNKNSFVFSHLLVYHRRSRPAKESRDERTEYVDRACWDARQCALVSSLTMGHSSGDRPCFSRTRPAGLRACEFAHAEPRDSRRRDAREREPSGLVRALAISASSCRRDSTAGRGACRLFAGPDPSRATQRRPSALVAWPTWHNCRFYKRSKTFEADQTYLNRKWVWNGCGQRAHLGRSEAHPRALAIAFEQALPVGRNYFCESPPELGEVRCMASAKANDYRRTRRF